MNVLLVLDSQPIRDRLVDRLLRHASVTIVSHLKNEEDVLRWIGEHAPQVVIVDIHLVGAMGIEVLRKVKRLKNPPLVITVSTSSHPQYSRQSMKEGADYCIQLPDEVDKLTELLGRVK